MQRAAATLAVDVVTAEVVRALATDGIRSIVLKGPSLREWLYGDGGVRDYGDTDILLAPSDLNSARTVLERIGFTSVSQGYPLPDGIWWVRDGMWVDLHRTLDGAEADPQAVWRALSRDTERQRVGGTQVEVLGAPGRLLSVVLHAARHGRAEEKPLADLSRAIERVPTAVWEAASRLAGEIAAEEAFAAGVTLLPEGTDLVRRLRVREGASARTLLFSRSAPGTAVALEDLLATRGVRGKLLFVARKLFPSTSYMEYLDPEAAAGRWPLLRAHLRRITGLRDQLLPGLRAWLAARRESR
jgi:Uncharacterised nucleotidyltransferase